MAQCYMTFDRLQETINLQNAILEASHKRTVQVMGAEPIKKRKSAGVYIVRKR